MPLQAARRSLKAAGLPRALQCASVAACALLLGSQSLQTAVANGDTRTITFHHLHTGEDLTVTYKRDGRYDDAALKLINHEMRDWRRNEEVRIDPRVIDIIWEVNREVGGKEPIEIVCGYRAPATNQMLRRRSRGVAQFSQHTLGKAVDFYIPGVSLEAIRVAGLRLQRGGVGFYPTSGSPFVHLDIGSVRHWPRMTHDQLARVFPNGRTVHIPSDGRPLAGYSLALADVQKHGSAPSQMSLDAAANAGVSATAKPQKNLLASLFGGKSEDDEDETTSADAAPTSAPRATTIAAAPAVASARVPLPTARPTIRVASAERDNRPAKNGSFVVASAESRPIDLAPPAPAAADNVFTLRGIWEGPQGRPEPPADIPDPAATQVADADAVPPLAPARATLAPRTVDLDTTGVVTPWPANRPGADRVPTDLALAYAAQNDGVAKAAPRPAPPPMGAVASRAAASNATVDSEALTTVIKKTIVRAVSPRAIAAVPGPTSVESKRPTVVAGEIYADPWLKAMLLAPDLQNYMTLTSFEAPDPLTLQPLMVKPASAVMMTFGNDPYLGMPSERFAGSAVVFVSTVTFNARTAMLR